MRNHIAIISLSAGLFLLAGSAAAQEGSRSGVGIGAQSTFGIANVTGDAVLPLGAGTFVYDAGKFHVTALLGYANVEDSIQAFALGGQFHFVVHSSQAADLSVGGGLGFAFVDWDVAPGDEDTETVLEVEIGAKVRAFIVPNVALSGLIGLGMAFGDNDDPFERRDTVTLGGQLIGSLGVTYFFY